MKWLDAKFLHVGLVATSLAVGASSASGVPVYRVELAFGDIDLTSATPLSESIGFHSGFEGTNFYSRDAFASAQTGLLRSSSTATIQLTPVVNLGLGLGLGPVLNGTDALAAFGFDDVIIPGPVGTTVSTSLNMHLDGGLTATAFAQLAFGFGAEVNAYASVSVGAFAAGNFFSGTQAIARLWEVDTGEGGGSTFEDGLLTGFTGNGGITTPQMNVPVGAPFSLSLSLFTSAYTDSRNAIIGSGRQAAASSLFDSTLSFPLFGPVFNLPEGYTANSPSGLILDNRWLGPPGPTPDPVSVPEPSSLLLLVTGLLCFARRFSRVHDKQ